MPSVASSAAAAAAANANNGSESATTQPPPQQQQQEPAASSTRTIKAVIYDLDGTLLDTEALSTDAIQAVVGRFGATFTWEIKKRILGMRGEEWGRIVVDELGLEGRLAPMALVKEWEKELAALAPTVRLLPGAKELVAFFQALELPQGIATSSSAALVAHKRERHEAAVFQPMATVVTGDDPAVKAGKPAGDIYLAAAERLGVAPQHCLVFEDALNGVLSGRAAGMQVVAVPDPRLDAEPFIEHAHQVLPSLSEFDPAAWGFQGDLVGGARRGDGGKEA